MMGIDAQMFVKTKQGYTERQVRHLAHDLSEAFYNRGFIIMRPDDERWVGIFEPRHSLELVERFCQDGPALAPEDGEQFVEVHLAGRYYGIGYERGDLPFLVCVALWLESRIPDAQVWYGGDSSGVCAEPFDATARQVLWHHFCNVGHEPYERGFDRGARVPECDFCFRPMLRYGWGPPGDMFRCAGCGHKLTSSDGGKTFQKPEASE